MQWESVAGLSDVWVFRESCNVYAVRGPTGWLVIDSGSGRWLEKAGELGLTISRTTVLGTHYFRDHSAGAAAAARAGARVIAPEYEREILADPDQHFRQRETYNIYDNLWDLFAPIEAVKIAGVARDYDTLNIAGLDVTVIPLPGVTLTQAGYLVVLPGGRRVVFCGEAIHSPGRLARIAPLQYNYNDLPGASQAYWSARHLRTYAVDALLPSLGEPMIGNADAALASLQDSLRFLVADRPGMTEGLDAIDSAPLERITDHVWRSAHSNSRNWFLLSKSGKVMVVDYGYTWPAGAWNPSYPKRYTRRSLLHGVEGLRKQFGIDRVDVALVSHFHDDHVAGIQLLQRVHGTQCWAAENFADLLAKPEAHCFPCNWQTPTRVDRRLALDRPFQWEEYTFHLAPMNGHTRFAALIGFEADGKRFAHTGDQYFFVWGNDNTPFVERRRLQNHVYRNGALLDGYDLSAEWMLKWRPEVVIQGHQPPFYTDESFFDHIRKWAEDYKANHRRAMVLGDHETHFNLDSWGGWIWPYRTHLKACERIRVTATVRNPFPRRATMVVRLIGGGGWIGETATLVAEARDEVSCELTITPPAGTVCRRKPIAVELDVDGRSFGQVAEALVTIGHDEF